MNSLIRCRLVYDGAQQAEPVLFRLGRDAAVRVAITSEQICARQGTVDVSLSGEPAEIEGALARLRSAGIAVQL